MGKGIATQKSALAKLRSFRLQSAGNGIATQKGAGKGTAVIKAVIKIKGDFRENPLQGDRRPLGPLKPLTVMIADFPFETELSEPKVLFPIENPRSLKP